MSLDRRPAYEVWRSRSSACSDVASTNSSSTPSNHTASGPRTISLLAANASRRSFLYQATTREWEQRVGRRTSRHAFLPDGSDALVGVLSYTPSRMSAAAQPIVT